MLKQTLTTLFAVAVASSVGIGQQVQAPVENKPPARESQRQPPTQAANVRVEITAITELPESGKVPPKTVTMLLADGEFGRVRTGQGNAAVSTGPAAAMLNVDARPNILVGDRTRVRVTLSLEYRRQQEELDKTAPSLLTQSLATILEDGKPLVISQSSDPTIAKSSVQVTAKATISR